MATSFSAEDFADKWRPNARGERASSHEHFINLCELLDAPTPNDADPSQTWYRFERHVDKTLGGKGYADVWRQGHFGWEYKGLHADLGAAYSQLLDYREALENPPLLVVSDMDRIEVRTNFTNTPLRTEIVTLDDLAAGGKRTAEALRILRAVMNDPDELRQEQSPDEVTNLAASRFAELAQSMQGRGNDPESVAHFLNRMLFCLFAEDVGLLPRRLMTDLVASARSDPATFTDGLSDLFQKMSDKEASRLFGKDRVEWFNGGLFDDSSALTFTREELRTVSKAAELDWSQVEPAILGTLFERSLDPSKRDQLGAHYTDREKILMVVEPVVMTPLSREFDKMKESVASLMKGRDPSSLTKAGQRRARLPTWERDAEAVWRGFLERLRKVRVLDPACGSGNFLYVTLRMLKDLERDAIRWGAQKLRITSEFPEVGPQNVLGIEKSAYARELAGVAIWIGHIQWMRDHGHSFPREPVLQPLDNIELRDAILKLEENDVPTQAEWPAAEFIVGNPPFLGDRRMRRRLGNEYVNDLRLAFEDTLPASVDLVCYWHEIARQQIAKGEARRAGLLATNSIRGGASRRVLDRIRASGDIFLAWADEPWVVDGDAAVRVSIVGQDNREEKERKFNGQCVSFINPDLTADCVETTIARALAENEGHAFVGVQKSGRFELTPDVARSMLVAPTNPFGNSNESVIRRWVNAKDLTDRPRDSFIVDFGTSMPLEDAEKYEQPFEFVREHVKPVRDKVSRKAHRERWWIHGDARPGLRAKMHKKARYICTPMTAKHRVFCWLPVTVLPSNATVAIACDDDYTFGVLHSKVHELWSLRMCTWMGVGNDPRYTPSTTFETFPFPWPLNASNASLTADQRACAEAIGDAARELDKRRSEWLNPPDWVVESPDVRPSLPDRFLPVDAEAEEELQRRTLTELYNERYSWLTTLHRNLDNAVIAAYGWPMDIDDETILERLLVLNIERADVATS